VTANIKSRVRTVWSRGDYPWLMTNLAKVYAQGQWLRQRWYLRKYDQNQWLQLGEDPTSMVNWVFEAYNGAFAPIQSKAELTELADVIKRNSPRFVLELGTARGGTFIVLCRMAADDAKLISVDLPAGIGGGGYPKWKIPVLSSFAGPNQTIYLLRADSHEESTFLKVREALGDQQLDMLFIDADHSYAGALTDYTRYSTLVRPGGLICFHDVVPNPYNDAIEVDRLWKEISANKDAVVIRDPANIPGFGIGMFTA
jgi:predicted O-methyltransferase YrrM